MEKILFIIFFSYIFISFSDKFLDLGNQEFENKNINKQLNIINNWKQMKLDGSKSHGKVFDDDGETVTIWCEVENILMKYKSSFCDWEVRGWVT